MEPVHEADTQMQSGKRLAQGRAGFWKIAAAVLAGAIVLVYGACCYLAAVSTSFFPHTFLNGVSVSRMTETEAVQAVGSALRGRRVDLTLKGEEQPFTTIPLADLLSDSPVDPADVSAVYAQQHSGLFSSGWHYFQSLLSRRDSALPYQWSQRGLDAWAQDAAQQVYRAPEDTTVKISGSSLVITTARDGRQVQRDAVRTLLLSLEEAPAADSYSLTAEPEVLPAKALTAREIYDQLHGSMKNAAYDAATGSIIPEQVGADFDVAAVQNALDSAAPGETLALDAEIEQPQVTAETLKAVLFRDVLGETRTQVKGTVGRIGNVKLSAAAINGVVLNSGDVFSYNQTVGKRTEARGYKPAPAYIKGETVDEVGGGICQTSSTLYLACLLSNLKITERYAHRFAPSYISWGMDATVSWGGPDYKFTNDTLYPIKIVTRYDNGWLTVQILGTNATGTHVKMTNRVLSDTPWETIYQEDPAMTPGSPEVVKVTPYTGHKVETYQTIYDRDGNILDSHFEASSNYKVRNKVICRAPADMPGAAPADIPADTAPADSSGETPDAPSVPAEPEEPSAIVVPPEDEEEML